MEEEEEKEEGKAAQPNYITPEGMKKLCDEYDRLLRDERPKLVKVIEWAAGNGDRSENADYIYGKRRLREIDSRLRFLNRRIEKAQVVEYTKETRQKAFFGATVEMEDEDGTASTYQIVGEDEADVKLGKISWLSPLGKALLGKGIDDEVTVKRPVGEKIYIVTAIRYA